MAIIMVSKTEDGGSIPSHPAIFYCGIIIAMMYIFKDMSKKKTSNKIKRVTLKEIVDAFYSGVSVCKITKMAQQLVKQEEVRKY